MAKAICIATAVAAALAVAKGQHVPRFCDSPGAFEANMVMFDYSKGYSSYHRVIYDEANKRTAQEEVVDARTPGAKFYLILNFFDDHTQYKIDTTDRKCYKGTIPDNEQWRPFGVPTGATFVQQVNVGIVGEGLTANEFVLTQKDHPKGYYYRGVFTAKDCAPVQEMILRNMTDLSQSVNAEYYDLVLGISNPNVFIPPAYCENALPLRAAL